MRLKIVKLPSWSYRIKVTEMFSLMKIMVVDYGNYNNLLKGIPHRKRKPDRKMVKETVERKNS
ncbi:MAG: hypothetical protein WDA22_04080 [Bacteroidota bacterium]